MANAARRTRCLFCMNLEPPEERRSIIVSQRKYFCGGDMEGWKKAVVAGSIGAATVLFMKKRYPAGVLAGGVGLALLASEYPENFEKVRKALPGYFDRGMQVME